MNIYVINGPNLNLVGKREQEIYGHTSMDEYIETLINKYDEHDIIYYQSNHEGDLIDLIQKVGFNDSTGIVLNAGGYTHTSIALRDAVSAITAPVIEVHISDIREREAFRTFSYLEDVCAASIVGKGLMGYDAAIELLEGKDKNTNPD